MRFWISQSKGCFVDLYEQPACRGKMLRLHGPADFLNLWVAPDDWGDDILSLAAGPGAYVLCYEELNLEESAAWLKPDQRVDDLQTLALRAEPDSIRLMDRPPFAGEPGYSAYLRQHGHLPPPHLEYLIKEKTLRPLRGLSAAEEAALRERGDSTSR